MQEVDYMVTVDNQQPSTRGERKERIRFLVSSQVSRREFGGLGHKGGRLVPREIVAFRPFSPVELT